MNEKVKYKLIVIGGSLGGFEALIKILSCLPNDFPIPIVVVLHRLRNTRSFLPELIQKHVSLKVKEADEKEYLQPGVVYICPANYHLLLEDDFSISLDSSPPENYSRPSINIFFESVARIGSKDVIAVILTGANNDGSKGLKEIADNGGLTVVENPETAFSDTMPRAAITACRVDYILDQQQIGELLLRIGKNDG